jgi:hypothetical protein
MPNIKVYLHDEHFYPETLRTMGRAYDAICQNTKLSHEQRKLVAQTIIALARNGEHNSVALARKAVRVLTATGWRLE